MDAETEVKAWMENYSRAATENERLRSRMRQARQYLLDGKPDLTEFILFVEGG